MLPLDRESLHIWHAKINLEAGSEPTLDFRTFLDASEMTKAEQLAEPRKSYYLESQGRLRQVLSYYLDEPPSHIFIKRHPYGKPYLVNHPNLAFNISHSASQWVIAVSRSGLLGVDIEYCRPRNNFAALVNRCFAEEEKTYWYNLTKEEKLAGFYGLWTKKEAFVKATGRGIGLGLTQCVVNTLQGNGFLRIPCEFGNAIHWSVAMPTITSGYCCAVVLNRPIEALSVYGMATQRESADGLPYFFQLPFNCNSHEQH